MSQLQSSTLTSLAMLKVNLDQSNGDYLDYLVPFVVHTIRTHNIDPVTEQAVGHNLKDDFGLVIPDRVVQIILRRLAKHNLLQRKHSVFHVCGDLPNNDMDARRNEASRHIQKVCDALIKYALESSTTWSEEDATRALLSFIGEFSIECLNAYARGTTLLELPPNDSKNLYLVSRFVKDAHDSNTQLFDAIIVVVKCHMLANALICPDLESVQRKFKHVTFYFDTPLVLGLLGLHGEHQKQATDSLLRLLNNLEAKTAVFEHTAQEVYRVIEWAENNIEKPDSYNATIIKEMRWLHKKKSDLRLIRLKLNDHFGRLGLVRHRNPPHDRQSQINEADLQSTLSKTVKYSTERAAACDINSIRNIYALRKGMSPCRLEDSVAVLVTSNTALARAAYQFGQSWEEMREVSSVITDFSLANVAWLKAPLGAPELPEREVLAMCYAAMEPRTELWNKYLDEIDRLKEQGNITAQDHELLRVSLRANDELMDLTLGSEAAFDGSTVSTILQRVKADLVKEQADILDAEQQSHEQTRRERDELINRNQNIQARIFWVSRSAAKWMTRILFAMMVTVIVVGSYWPAHQLPDSVGGNRLIWWLGFFSVLITTIWGIFGNIFGWSLIQWKNRIHNKLEHSIYNWLLRMLNLLDGHTD